MNKREIVEAYLNCMCQNISIMVDFDAEEHEIQEELNSVDGLITFVEYEPYSLEWETFMPEGFLWTKPTDEQVDKLYQQATEYFNSQ